MKFACKTSILERNAKRKLRESVGKDVAVATAIAVGRGWSVAWTGEHNGTTEVLVGVEKDGVGAVAVASVHLDAGSEDKRVQLLGATLAAARARMGGGRNLRVIVAGDMNAEFKVGSALGAVVSPEDGDAADARRECTVALRRAPDDAELEAWAELRRIARFDIQKTLRSGLLGRVPTGPTRCGYDHEVAGSTAMRAWSLDHLLYSPATLAPVARWATLEADPKALAEGLPNASWPSDHLPVAACVLRRVSIRSAERGGDSGAPAIGASRGRRQRRLRCRGRGRRGGRRRGEAAQRRWEKAAPEVQADARGHRTQAAAAAAQAGPRRLAGRAPRILRRGLDRTTTTRRGARAPPHKRSTTNSVGPGTRWRIGRRGHWCGGRGWPFGRGGKIFVRGVRRRGGF